MGCLLTGCITLKDTTKVVTVPTKTVVTVGKNGGKIITNYYDYLGEINENNEDDERVRLWIKEF
jgi:hypothetical protein